MRSPQFLETMKEWMDNAVTFRKMSNDFMANVRNEMQATSREDVDTIMLTVRHMEQRILDRVEVLTAQVAELEQRLDGVRRPAAAAKTGKPKERPAQARAQRRPQKSK